SDDALAAAALYRELGDRFYQGKMLLRAGAGRLMQDGGPEGAPSAGQSGESLLREARDLLAPFGNTKTLAHCLSALASAPLLVAAELGVVVVRQEQHQMRIDQAMAQMRSEIHVGGEHVGD